MFRMFELKMLKLCTKKLCIILSNIYMAYLYEKTGKCWTK